MEEGAAVWPYALIAALIVCLICQAVLSQNQFRKRQTQWTLQERKLSDALSQRQAHTRQLTAELTQNRVQQQSLSDALSHQQEQCRQLTEALTAQQDVCAHLTEENQLLSRELAQKEQQIAALSQPPAQKLYVPDLPEETAAAQEDAGAFGQYTVYFNERTGIYHVDRYCAPHLVTETHLFKIIDHARPCKKCAEGFFSFSSVPDWYTEDPSQLSLFDTQ